jgi:hypothetical protein
MAAKTTIIGFCSTYLTTLKLAIQLATNTTTLDLLLTLNILHPLDKIHTAHKKIINKLIQLGLYNNHNKESSTQLTEAFHYITKNRIPLDNPASDLTNIIIKIPADQQFPFKTGELTLSAFSPQYYNKHT